MTNSFEIAHRYGQCYVKDEGTAKQVTYLFVNKVKETLTNSSGLCRECKKRQSLKISQPLFVEKNYSNLLKKLTEEKKSSTLFVKSTLQFQDSRFSYEPVLKVFDRNSVSDKRVKFKRSENLKLDSNGNEILSGTFQVVYDEKK